MDFGQAALLITVLVGLAQIAKSLVFGSWDQRKTTAVVLVVAIVAVLLVSQSAWANEVIVGNRQLDQLGIFSQILVAVLLAGGSSTVWEIFTTVKNVGNNQPPRGVRYGEYGELERQDHAVDVADYPAGHPLHVDRDPRLGGEVGQSLFYVIGVIAVVIIAIILLVWAL